MNFSKIFFLFLMIFFWSINNVQAQKNVIHQNMLWARYYNQLTLHKNWSLHTELDSRTFLNGLKDNLYLVRMVGRYKFSEKMDAGFGGAYFSVATQNPNKANLSFRKPEYRLQQDIILKQQFHTINLSHLYQIEERFFRNYDDKGSIAGSTFMMRFRYRLLGGVFLWKTINQYLKALVYDELMINAGKNASTIFDQNRIYAGIQYGFSKAVELGYLNSFQQQVSVTDYFAINIIRLSVYHILERQQMTGNR